MWRYLAYLVIVCSLPVYPVFLYTATMFTACVSNSLEALYLAFLRDYEASCLPLQKRFIAVPHEGLISYLQRRLAEDNAAGIFFGATILTLEETVTALFKEEAAIELPTHLDIMLRVEDARLHPLVRELLWYGPGKRIETEELKKAKAACLNFVSPLDEMKTFQYRTPLFLFGFSSIEESFFGFFERGQAHTRGYFLSPSMMYWEDVVSDKTAEKLVAKAASFPHIESRLKELLFDRHPLLANCGMKGRLFFTRLFDSGIEIEECYQESAPITLLSYLQHDLLHLEQTVQHAPKDDSIQIHSCLSIQSEVEALYETLLQFSAGKTLNVGDLVVFVEDLPRYRPFIESVFSASKSPFSYQICSHTKELERGSLLFHLVSILTLIEKRGAKEEFLELLESEAFCRRCKIARDEKGAIRAALSKIKSDFFGRDDFVASLELQGIQAANRAEKPLQESFIEAFVSTNIEASSAASIAAFLEACQKLMLDLRSLFKKNNRSLIEWAEYVQALVATYFEPSSKEKNEMEVLYEAIEVLFKSGLQEKRAISLASFNELFLKTIQECLAETGRFQRAELLFMETAKLPCSARFVGLLNAKAKNYEMIEAILSAKEQLAVFYQGYSFDERAILSPPPAVGELLKALAKENFIVTHKLQPPVAKQERASPLLEPTLQKSAETIIDLSQLQQAARNPLKLYFQQALSIVLPGDIEDDFTALDLYLIKKESLSNSKEEFMAACRAHLKVPKNTLESAYMSYFENIYDQNRQILQQIGKSETVEHSIGSNTALQVGKFLVTGRLEGVAGSTLITFQDLTREEFHRRWPELLFMAATKGSAELFSLKEQRSKKIEIKEPRKKLEAYLEYTLQCGCEPFALFPQKIGDFLAGKKGSSMKDPYKDPYLELLEKRVSAAELENLYAASESMAKSLFHEEELC